MKSRFPATRAGAAGAQPEGAARPRSVPREPLVPEGAARAAMLLTVLLCIAPAGAQPRGQEGATRPASERPLTTYEKFLPLAVAGDPAIQYFLGYMFFYGEGVELNYDEAHYWFHLAAEEGDARAQRNLGIFHARALARIPPKFYDAAEANLWFSLAAANAQNPDYSRLASRAWNEYLGVDSAAAGKAAQARRSGKSIYRGACAGCHGFDGVAAYPGAPSFARGERLDKDNAELIAGILDGKAAMPPWRATLSQAQTARVVAYLRRRFGRRAAAAQAPPATAPDQRLALGERIYLQFCGGCHGFNGIAWYVNSPSFALGERLHKSDAELKHSIKQGRGAMPSWEYMLKPGQIDALIAFIRTLAPSYESGLVGELRRPAEFLRFRPQGETGPDWTGGDLR